MGANFQVFLIASVPAPEGGYVYQCVGAFNHFYCFGIRPLRALYRFFSLLRVRENAAMVRDELRSFGTWNLRDDPLEEWMNPAVPCPYAVSLLSIAWTTDLEHLPYLSNYSLGNGLLDARKDCWHRARKGVDQEGICVIDISDIETPAYCFVRKAGARAGSAWQYLYEVYPSRFRRGPRDWSPEDEELPHDKETEDKRFLHALEAFWALVDLAGYSLVSALSLLQIWPNSVARVDRPVQVKVPTSEDLPMPLDIVISLFLGLTDPAFSDAFARVLGTDGPRSAIGKAILPPYELGPPKDTIRRTFVVQAILADWRPFQYVLDPPYLSNASDHPGYTILGESGRFKHWVIVSEQTIGSSRARLSHYYPQNIHTASDRSGLYPSLFFPGLYLDPVPLRLWASQPSIQQLDSILRPEQLCKAFCKGALDGQSSKDKNLAMLDANILLDTLWLGLHELTDTAFLDLSGLQLFPDHIIKLLKGTTGVEALSISGNSKVQPEHLPAILNSSPSLRRIHCMHWTSQIVSNLQSVRAAHPELFRQLEGFMCPPLLSCNYAAPPFISFAFHHNTRVSIENSYFVSVPFFTPSQVVQSITDILPLAFQENRYGESADLWMRDLGLAMQTGPNAYANPTFGVPFFMASPMVIRASLSGSAPRPGQAWNERPIISVPATGGDFDFSQSSDHGIWVFHFDWDHRRDRFRARGRNQWGFIHYQVAERCTMPAGLSPVGAEVLPAAPDTSVKNAAHSHAGTIFLFIPGDHDEFAEPSDSVSESLEATNQETSPPSEGQTAGAKESLKLAELSATTPSSEGNYPVSPDNPSDAAGYAVRTTGPGSSLSAEALVSPGEKVHARMEEGTRMLEDLPFQPQSREQLAPSPLADSSEGCPTSLPAPKEHEWLRFVGTVYDLRGFLRCMADEGRPLPNQESVERLERILDTRDPASSALICELMEQDAELPLSGWRRTCTADERKERFDEEYGGLGKGRFAHFWTPSMFPARVTRAAHGAFNERDLDPGLENYLLPIL